MRWRTRRAQKAPQASRKASQLLVCGSAAGDGRNQREVTSANLTPDTATGIGKWTEQQFLDKFRNYRDKASYSANPGKNNSIMPWTMYANMTDFDIKAIYRFLQTLPPVNNKVEKYPPAK